jgi:uncharacterized membrane protein YdjX (TVP38/TMEM64 family)
VRYLGFLAIALAAAFAAAFVLAEAVHVPLLSDPSSYLAGGQLTAAAIGVGLLAADVVLPVPSSVLMTVHGALFGVAAGAALSLVGSLGSAAIGYGIGRAGSPVLERIVVRDERLSADRIVQRWGGLAVALAARVPAGVGSEGFVGIDRDEFREVLRDGARWAIGRGFGVRLRSR